MNYTDPTKRQEFVLLFDVKNGNPNGDPDAGNFPRINPETMHGLVTDVCIKRKVRDYVANILERPIFIQSETALNTIIYQAARNVGIEPAQVEVQSEDLIEWLKDQELDELELDGHILRFTGEKFDERSIRASLIDNVESETIKKELQALIKQLGKASKGKSISREDRAKIRANLMEGFYDIRMFGAVLSTGINAGQVRGPMQLSFSESVDEIIPNDVQITRVAITREEDMVRKQTEMGRKAIVPYGLYRCHGFFSPYDAKKTKATGDDLSDFWEALEKMFEFDHSAARGEMHTRGLWVFTHENEKGNAPAHKLFELVDVQPCGGKPHSFDDYNGKITPPGDGPVPGFPEVTVKRLV